MIKLLCDNKWIQWNSRSQELCTQLMIGVLLRWVHYNLFFLKNNSTGILAIMVQFNTNIIFITNISFDTLRLSDAYIGSDNGLLPGQAIIWASDGILLIGFLGTNFSEIEIYFLLTKCIWKCHLENGGHFVSASMCYMLYCTHLPIKYVVLGELDYGHRSCWGMPWQPAANRLFCK